MDQKTDKHQLSAEQRQSYEAACAKINPDRLKHAVCDVTGIHSPTGAEREASEFMVDYMHSVGIDAFYQPVNEMSGNCVGYVKGTGEGPSLMLYAPIDTHIEADPNVDIPWVGPELRADMLPHSYIEGDTVFGLGASNPKSMLCTLTEAVTCIVEAGIELKGDLIVATCGGGMPWFVPERDNYGISSGVMHMLSHGIAPDFGIIFKPWDEVYYEHPGMAWFKVTTWGTMGYAGIPRGVPGFRSSIVPAAKVIFDLEQWLSEYPDKHESAQIRGEGWISAVRSGWPEKPAFPSAATEIYLDVRTTPDQTNADIEAEFSAVMKDIVARHDDVDAEWEMYVSCPGFAHQPRPLDRAIGNARLGRAPWQTLPRCPQDGRTNRCRHHLSTRYPLGAYRLSLGRRRRRFSAGVHRRAWRYGCHQNCGPGRALPIDYLFDH